MNIEIFLSDFQMVNPFAQQKFWRQTEKHDLAIIMIDTNNLPVLSLREFQRSIPRPTCFCYRQSFRLQSQRVTRGVISAIRELEFGDGRPLVQVAIPIGAR